MYKTLLVCLLLSLGCKAQRFQFIHTNGVIVGEGPYSTSACFSMKLTYDINDQLQAGINGTLGAEYFADIFCNWYPAKVDAHSGIFLGVNVGRMAISFKDTDAQRKYTGKGVKAGFQLGFTTPVFTAVGFYFELDPSVGWVTTQSESFSGYALRGGFGPSPPVRENIFFMPIQAGLRYRL